jgi:hypothetical protein
MSTERIKLLKRLSLIFTLIGALNLLIGLILHLSEASMIGFVIVMTVGASFLITSLSLALGALLEGKRVAQKN